MRLKHLRCTAAVALLLGTGSVAWADDMAAANNAATDAAANAALTQKIKDVIGLDFFGYARGGYYDAASNAQVGQYQLGGDLQHYRLGNEGDNYAEFGMRKKIDLGGGLQWGITYQPKIYNGTSGTAQIYSELSGLEFDPGMKLWAGQRYHRIQDVHILDNWVMQDGDNYGAGADDIQLGRLAKLNLSLSTQGNSDNQNNQSNAARRFNFQLHDLPTNAGGKLTITGAVLNGNFAIGPAGSAFGLLHNQEHFILPGMNNALFLQTSSGHAGITGEFYNLDTPDGSALAGATQSRIVDTVDWQFGKLGGQAVVGYQTITPSNAVTGKDLSLGGRLSYGLARNTKLLAEVGLTSRDVAGTATQQLNKETLALAFAPNTDFWTRPEFRIYASWFNWNSAAALANMSTFGVNNATSATTFGMQMEAWW